MLDVTLRKRETGAVSNMDLQILFCRKLQEDLTDEMVGLARQLKETSLLMNQSIQNTEKVRLQFHENQNTATYINTVLVCIVRCYRLEHMISSSGGFTDP